MYMMGVQEHWGYMVAWLYGHKVGHKVQWAETTWVQACSYIHMLRNKGRRLVSFALTKYKHSHTFLYLNFYSPQSP